MSRLIQKIWKTARSKRGSTIVGVLAAMVFITLVTSYMVKNTGAQSAASIGYGTAMTMHSTLVSGIMATEAAFAKDANKTVLPGILEAVHNNNPSFVPGLVSGTSNKVSLGGNQAQFFSSKLERITADVRGETQLATCAISSGTKAGGRGLRNAKAFFAVEGLKYRNPSIVEQTPVITPVPRLEHIIPECNSGKSTSTNTSTSTSENTVPNDVAAAGGGNNAVYMAGNLQDGNNGMEVNGGATFEGEVRFQNKKAIFNGETFFQKDVYFLAQQSYEFKGNAYFYANLTFQNIDNDKMNMFKASVGVNGNLLADNKTLSVPGDFYINGNFSSTTTRVKGTGSGKKAYYTKTFTANQSQLEYTNKKDTATMDIPKLMGMKNLDERRETPLISYDEIITKITNSGAVIKSVDDVIVSPSDRTLSVTKLTNLYNSLPASQLYQGHLVVNVDYPNKYDELKTHGLNSTTFEKKVIFLVKSGKIASNGSFYCSSPTSSTMIYIGKNGLLESFGSNCLFRGYIYIDKTNTSTDNGFYWGLGSSIEGAFHNFSDKQFKWNFKDEGAPTKITYNESVLAPFFTLRKGGYVAGLGGGSGGSTSAQGTTTVTTKDSVTTGITNGTKKVVTQVVTVTTVTSTQTTVKITTTVTETQTIDVVTCPSPYDTTIYDEVITYPPSTTIPGGYTPTPGKIIPRAKGYYFY